ncbi:MAG: FtsX-like permease family protein [Zavarzinella sp.]|nr:FtsX-like permease family protein [Zavarzinella sp.]
MNYSLATLWHERPRFLPGIGAVAFSAVLIALQCGLLLGLFTITSLPVDHSNADVWVGSSQVLSVDLGRPLPLSMEARIAGDDRVLAVEGCYNAYASLIKEDGGSELCVVIGSSLEDDSMGAVQELTPQMRELLTEPNTIVVDESEKRRVGVNEVGDHVEINKVRVRIVGMTKGLKSLAGPYVFCSRDTAKFLLRNMTPRGHVTYFLVRCRTPDDAESLAADLNREYADRHDMTVMTADEFSRHSRWHWLLKTKAGIALGYTALVGLLVGMVVTSQTLYAATTASAKEYAILLAMGIPRRKVTATVLVQSFWVGLFGVIVSVPVVHGLAWLGRFLEVIIPLPWPLLAMASGVTLVMSLIAGLFALRSVRQIEPMSLLR